MILLYNIALIVFSIFLLPWLLYRSIFKEKYRIGIRQRLGFYPQEILKKKTGKKLIWIHAVSVGEALAVKPLLTNIRVKQPEYQILISTTTLTGYKICTEKIAQKEDLVIFSPLDYYWTVKKSIKIFQPSLIMLMETELWPNFIYFSSRKGIPVLLINGRISDRSYTKYLKCRLLMRKILKHLVFLGMQSEKDAERIVQIGADRNKVEVIPSLKYETAAELAEKSFDKEANRRELSLPASTSLITGGSTHSGEESALISVYQRLKQDFPDICLLLAPRHPHRIKEIMEDLNNRGIDFNLRSKIKDNSSEYKSVIILDTLGELTKFYAISTVAFIGKSLYGIGGQNPMEPAALGIPVIFGKNMTNFEESSNLLLSRNAGIQINNDDDLYNAIKNILENPLESAKMGERGREAILSMKGAIARLITIISKTAKK